MKQFLLFILRHKIPHRAYTLVEMVIVLGIIGIVLAAIWLVGSEVWENNKLYKAQQQILTVVQNVRDAFGLSGRALPGGAANFNMTNLAANEGLIPREMIRPGGGCGHALGGVFQLWAMNALLPGSIRVRLNGLSQEECTKILMQFPFLTPEIGAIRVATQTNATVINILNITDPGSGVALPFTTANAQTWCSNTTNANRVDIDFRIRR